ncbi:MAG: SBBP repeat-containing protein [Vicingaceae bacterium]|nr:SBBP repeat-containing protein [Vicingaceae bacterium]
MKKLTLFLALSISLTALNAQQTCITATNLTTASSCNYSSHTTTGTDYWLKFTATSPTVNISLVTVKFDLNATHIHNLALYSGSCSNPILVADDELPFVEDAKELAIDLNASGLVVGQSYYLKATRLATHKTCDKGTCTANGSTNPTVFDICVQDIDVIIPLDFGLEPPQISHAYTTNRGQLVDISGNLLPEIKLYTINANPQVYVANDKLHYVFSKTDTSASTSDTLHRVDMSLVGTLPTKVFKTEQTSDLTNYYLGHIPQGVTNNKSYSRAVCNEIYPNIDVQYYSNSEGIKQYFIVKQGGNANDIILKFDGANAVNVTPNGGLEIVSSIGTLDFEPPHAYQVNNGNNIVPMPWQAKFIQLSATTVKFDIRNYPENMPLFIQVDRGHRLITPTPATGMCWSTYFGGMEGEISYGITNDNLQNTFITGNTSSINFPENVGQVLFVLGGNMPFITKFSDLNELKWSTFYGGSDNQTAYDIKTNSNNEVYVVGHTASSDFPLVPVTGKYFDGTLGSISGDGFIAKFDNNNGFATWSTYFGGNGFDQIFGVAIDNNNAVYITGRTSSTLNFPLLNLAGAYNQVFNGTTSTSEGFITKFNNNDALIWSTYIGGSSNENMNSIAIDANNNVLLSGETFSTDFPTVNPFGGAFIDNTLGGNQDQNLLKFSPTGQLIWSTYIGGSDDEFTFLGSSNRIAFDNANNIYLVGTTTSTDFPVFQSTGFFDGLPATSWNGYIMKFAQTNLSRLWSSYISGSGPISLSTIVTDKINNNVYIAGTNSDNNIPLVQQPNIYFQNTLSGQGSPFQQDACLFGFNDNNDMLLGTYFGGYQQASEGEFIMDMSITNQKLYFTGFTSAQSQSLQDPFPLFDSGFPAYYDDTYNGGFKDVFVSEICVDLVTAIDDIIDKERNFYL